VDEGDRVAVVRERVVDRLADEALRSELGDGLDADADRAVVDDVGDLHVLFQEVAYLLGLVGAGLPLDAGVDVLGVLPEGDHVHLLRVLDGRRDAVDVVGRADVRVQVERLAERDVQRSEAGADGRRQRPLDRDAVVADGRDGVLGEVLVVHLPGAAAGVDAHPRDGAARRLRGRVQYLLGGRSDVGADPVTVNDRDDRVLGNVQLAGFLVGERDGLAVVGDVDLIVAHERACVVGPA